jgi:RHS repeat-associated protein
MKFLFYIFLFLPFIVQAEEIPLPDDQASVSPIPYRSAVDNSQATANVSNVLEGGPPSLAGSVDVVSGKLCDFHTDLIIPGSDPLVFDRTYSSDAKSYSCLGRDWLHPHHSRGHVDVCSEITEKGWGVTLSDGSGDSGYYGTPAYNYNALCYHLPPFRIYGTAGITNLNAHPLSGKSHVKNKKIYYQSKDGAKVKGDHEAFLELSTGAGSVKKYRSFYYYCYKRMQPGKTPSGKKKKAGSSKKENMELSFLLSKQKKPNGNYCRYTYEDDGSFSGVKLFARTHELLSYLDITYAPEKKGEQLLTLTGSNRLSAHYKLRQFPSNDRDDKQTFLVEAESQNKSKIFYDYADYSTPGSYRKKWLLVRKKAEGGYCQEIEYYWHGNNRLEINGETFHVVPKAEHLNQVWGRVRQQKAPLGTDATPVIAHSYTYVIHKPGSKECDITNVYDAYNHKTSYQIDPTRRLTKINYHTGTSGHALYKVERFRWGDPNNDQETNLMAHSLENPHGGILAHRTFVYDKNHNTAWTVLHGNLTGTGPDVAVDTNGNVSNNCECYQKYYEYSDNKNLLLYERDIVTEKEIEYRYWENTDLLEHKFVIYGGVIREREFYAYEGRGVLCEVIVDDGTSRDKNNLENVTQRCIKGIGNTCLGDCPAGIPRILDEKYQDLATGAVHTMKRTINHYNVHGWLIQQDVYDSNGNISYVKSWEYDSKGNAILERDALGHTTVRQFDVNGNIVYEKIQGQACHFVHQYDLCNRLIRSDRIADTGERWSISHKYDYLSNRTATIDIYGNETRFVYDDFNRLVKTICPAIPIDGGQLFTPSVSTDYNILNHPEKITDARGLETRTRCTVFGKPYVIDYPDGSSERFEYNKNGTLKKAVEKNGSYTLFTYDYQSRPIRKDNYSSSGALLNTYSYEYNAFHLLKEIDPMGLETRYSYNIAGQLVKVVKGTSQKEFSYDPLGRLVETKEYYGQGQYISKKVKLDILGRVLEETVEDSKGTIESKICQVYDDAGNCIEKSSYGQAGMAVTRIRYDAWNQAVEVIDAAGASLRTFYRYDHYNEWGQCVPYTEIVDPQGQVTTTICNTQGKVAKITHSNPFGQITKKEEHFYDAAGNRIRLLQTVISPDSSERTVTTVWEYDAMNHVTAFVEAVQTPEQKTTRYGYNQVGQLEAIYKPDGVILYHAYDAMGLLSRYESSDGTIGYSYEYDRKGNLLRAVDLRTGKATVREYDVEGRISKETLENGLSLSCLYDRMGRLTDVRLPDRSGVAYRYCNSRLQQVARFSPSGEEKYAHTYAEYDGNGKVLTEKLALHGGIRKASYNILGRLKLLDAEVWKEKIETYDAVGNILHRTIEDAVGKQSDGYAYDDLYQLSSEKGRYSHAYQHDSLNNRLKKDDEAYSINGLNQVLRAGDAEYQYDLNGNRSKHSEAGRETCYTYDALDRLVKVQTGDRKVIYRYDSYNRRLGKTVHARSSTAPWHVEEEVSYLYIQNNEIGSCDAKGNIRELRILGQGLGAEIGAAVALELSGKIYVPMHDHNGNVMAIVDAMNGEVAETYRYTAFGEEEIFDGDHASEQSINPWRFSSKRTDPETGLVWFGRRMYDPRLGKWTTPDPIGFEGGPNLYAYVNNNPLNHIDLYGLVDDSESLFDNLREERRREQREERKQQYRKDSESNSGSSESSSGSWNPVKAFGTALQIFADHVLPIPFVREGFSRLGHYLAGGTPETYASHCTNPHSHETSVGAAELGAWIRIVGVNGILNSLLMAESTAEDISNALYGALVHFIYNSSHGTSFDLLECVAGHLNICVDVVHILAGALRQAIKDVKKADPAKGVVWAIAHSQGGLILFRALQHLTKEERSYVQVVTIGSAKMIGKSLGLRGYDNYVNTWDLVSWISDPIGCILGLLQPDRHVHFMKSNGPFDHTLDHPNYQKAIMNTTTDILKTYEGKS